MFKLASLALAFTFWAGAAQAAMLQLGTPFPNTCYGVLSKYRDVEDGKLIGVTYGLESEDKNASYECKSAIIAQTSRKDTYVSINGLRSSDYTLKEDTIQRLLKHCSVGKFCQISGQMNGLTHGTFFWVDIYSIVGFPWTPLPVLPGSAPEQVNLGGQIFHGVGNVEYDPKDQPHFNRACADCHSTANVSLDAPPSLTDGKWVDSDGSLAGITRKIRGGGPKPKNKPVPVPAHGGALLSDSDVAAVAAYVWAIGQPDACNHGDNPTILDPTAEGIELGCLPKGATTATPPENN
jgi:hypothetical protein